ncbi:hypothetical protein PI93_013525 [Pandoraea fibrosis]|uniref:Fimbrial protein n=1 Tax=Pandoraea fibrosis TaxID=1891094 RepID=A0ABX6HRP2_9BURK|nr:type 1 fimbrial protein [Pandoraea fibrosis]QHE92894.1 hypothetical protein PJ20_014475 [Pandoraea fibrosis]QHF13549.1 hypothetical protein PI93_013525 [Pandoraea fibrosis]
MKTKTVAQIFIAVFLFSVLLNPNVGLAATVDASFGFSALVSNGVCEVPNVTFDFGEVSQSAFNAGNVKKQFGINVQCDGATLPVSIAFSAENGDEVFRYSASPGVGLALTIKSPNYPLINNIRVKNDMPIDLSGLDANSKFDILMDARIFPMADSGEKPFVGQFNGIVTVKFTY